MTPAATLTSLTLTDFRNYPALQIETPAPIVVATGPNGAGKTNLLEAISLLTPGRGMRRAAYSEMTRIGAPGGWAVAAKLDRAGEEIRLGTGIVGSGEGETGRRVRVNGAGAAAEALLEHIRLLWLTPAMDGLFTGPAGDRRRFLDRLVLTIDPEHGRRVRDFERLLTSRNRLLEEGGSTEWLDAVEAQLAAVSVAVSLARGETVALLSAQLGGEASGATPFPAGRLSLNGDFDREIANRPAAEAEYQFRQTLRGGRPRDRAARRTLDGPHRSDLDVVFAAKNMPAALSSTGEQKALLIGLILAHADLVAAITGMPPILLLDEVAAHLDAGRRAALFERLRALGGQSFMTGTDRSLFSDIGPDSRALHVVSGTVEVLE